MLADLHFLRPYWLLAMLPVVIFGVLLFLHRRQQSPWHKLIAPHLQQALLGGELLLKRQPLALPFLLLLWCVSVIALAGPSWQKLPQPAFTLKKATVLVLDMSMSMRATDMAPDRLTQMRYAALDYTAKLAEGELALISFAGDAFVISPLTPDHNNIRLLIPDLKPDIMPVQGSNLLAALQQADKLLQQAGYPQGDVVVFTDGFEQNSLRDMQDLLNNWSHRLSILAFGSKEGAPVKLESGELLKSATGAVVIPSVPVAQLASLARQGGGVFAQATTADNQLSAILDIPALNATDLAGSDKKIEGDQWQDGAIYLVWILLPLLLFVRRYHNLLGILLLVTIVQQPAQAFEWRDLWQTRQQQAIQDYQQGAFSEAQRKFTEPLWQGNAAYRNGDYQAAEQAYKQATELHDNADAWHNLGNALAQQQRYEDALEAYQQALGKNPDYTPSQQNAELMQQLMQQQQQSDAANDQQQKDGEKQQQSSDDSKQDSQSSDNASDADSQSQQQDGEQQNPEQTDDSAEQQQAEQQPAEQQEETMMAEQQQQAESEDSQIEAVQEAWPNATPEEQQQLDNLLRKVQDDPALLLRNKMYLEYLKRQQQRLPKGAEQQW